MATERSYIDPIKHPVPSKSSAVIGTPNSRLIDRIMSADGNKSFLNPSLSLGQRLNWRATTVILRLHKFIEVGINLLAKISFVQMMCVCVSNVMEIVLNVNTKEAYNRLTCQAI